MTSVYTVYYTKPSLINRMDLALTRRKKNIVLWIINCLDCNIMALSVLFRMLVCVRHHEANAVGDTHRHMWTVMGCLHKKPRVCSYMYVYMWAGRVCMHEPGRRWLCHIYWCLGSLWTVTPPSILLRERCVFCVCLCHVCEGVCVCVCVCVCRCVVRRAPRVTPQHKSGWGWHSCCCRCCWWRIFCLYNFLTLGAEEYFPLPLVKKITLVHPYTEKLSTRTQAGVKLCKEFTICKS